MPSDFCVPSCKYLYIKEIIVDIGITQRKERFVKKTNNYNPYTKNVKETNFSKLSILGNCFVYLIFGVKILAEMVIPRKTPALYPNNYQVCDQRFGEKFKFVMVRNRTNLKAGRIPTLNLTGNINLNICTNN